MSNLPSVSIITPTTLDREQFNDRIKAIGLMQDYRGEWEHLFSIDDGSIGSKLNYLCAKADGDIIIRMDSDDRYSLDWVTNCVAALLISKADIVGLSNAYFYRESDRQLLEYANQPNSQLYLCGATLAFHRKAWERKPFPETSNGEDLYWQTGNGKLFAHDYKHGFLATLHGNNTCSHKAVPIMKKVALCHPLLPK